MKVKFDFSELIITKGYIDNFGSFWDCKFDDLTLFIECYLMNLGLPKSKKIDISQQNFQDCVKDDSINIVLSSNSENKENKKGNAKTFLDSFFHLFLSNGRLERQSENSVVKVRFSGINKYSLPYKQVIKILKSNNVITIYDNKTGPKIEILDPYKEDIYKFVKDGTMSNIVSTLINEFSKI